MNWERYWALFPQKFGRDEYLRQVQNTVGGKPTPEAVVEASIERIAERLALGAEDRLLDLCCGNGFMTVRLARRCRQAVGVDFSATMIDVARQAHGGASISYHQGNALDLSALAAQYPAHFTKLLINSGLQYFRPRDLARLLRAIRPLLAENAVMLFTAIPDRARKWQFYNSFRRRLRHLWQSLTGQSTMGSWWDAKALLREAEREGFAASIYTEACQEGFVYRFDLKLVGPRR